MFPLYPPGFHCLSPLLSQHVANRSPLLSLFTWILEWSFECASQSILVDSLLYDPVFPGICSTRCYISSSIFCNSRFPWLPDFQNFQTSVRKSWTQKPPPTWKSCWKRQPWWGVWLSKYKTRAVEDHSSFKASSSPARVVVGSSKHFSILFVDDELII